jgi:AcrR family transcriptional regulator
MCHASPAGVPIAYAPIRTPYTQPGDSRLPASIMAAWGQPRPPNTPNKGTKTGLSMERIVQSAVQIAARKGLSAVSMSRVASQLGSSAMSLYRYVSAKEELLALMVDAALGRPPAAPSEADGWRAGLSRWAWGYHAARRRHHWVLQVPISGPPVTPNLTAWLEEGLCSLRDTPLTEGQKLSVMLLLSGFVRNDATIAADIGAPTSTSRSHQSEIMPAWGRSLARLTDAQHFPALHAALGSGVFDQDDDPDDEFVFGLDRILDGIEALIRAQTPVVSQVT